MSRWPDRTLLERFEELYMPEPMSGCFLWLGYANACGYGTIQVDGRSRLAHRVSWELFVGPIPIRTGVLHRCDTPPCVNPDHLWLGTPRDNARDRNAKHRHAPQDGEESHNHKLSWAEVRVIRQRHANGERMTDIAASYGVVATCIFKVVHHQSWKEPT